MKKITKTFLLLGVLLLILMLASCKKLCLHFKKDVTVVPPTCTEGGYTIHQCKKCDYYYLTDELDPLGHDIKSENTLATCDTQGYTTNTCFCGYEYISDYIMPLGHSFIDYVTDPDCDEYGHTVHKCNVCDYEYTDTYISATGHTLKASLTEPTCTEQGYTDYACECGFTYRSDYVKANGHTFTEKVTDPTCTATGYTLFICDCGYSYTSDFTEPYGHTYTSTVVAATCAKAGYTSNVCKCGHTFTSDIVSALGHAFEVHNTMPTVSDMGYSDYTCARCNFKYRGNYRFYSEILPNGAYAENSVVLAQGIDTSIYNHTDNSSGAYTDIDWDALVTEGIDYVILKAGSTQRYSGGGKDPAFDKDYVDAKEAGLDVGVYFYTYAKNVSQIKADAEYLLSILKDKQFEYPIYLDLEDASLADIEPSILTEMCVTFFGILQENGYYTGLYVNNSWLQNILQTEKILDLFEIWYARYPLNTNNFVWNTNQYGPHLGMWQYTDNGTLPSLKKVDMNFAYKDYPAIIKALGLNGY